jgi:hypothetical protein
MTWCTQLDLFLNSAWSRTVRTVHAAYRYLGPRGIWDQGPCVQSSIGNHWTSSIRDQVTMYTHAKVTMDLVHPGSRNHAPFFASKIHFTFPRRPHSRVREFLLYGTRISFFITIRITNELTSARLFKRNNKLSPHVFSVPLFPNWILQKIKWHVRYHRLIKMCPQVHAPIRGRLQITFDLQ